MRDRRQRGTWWISVGLVVLVDRCGLFDFAEPTHGVPDASAGATASSGAAGVGAPSAGTSGSAGSAGTESSDASSGGGAAGASGGGGAGAVSSIPSCRGDLACRGESCCTSIPITGCTDCGFPDGATSTISDYSLDKYEVTVGRFRNFVEAYQGPPAAGFGMHPARAETGWQSSWDSHIATDAAALSNEMLLRPCQPLTNRTWTEIAGSNEDKPINCVTWYEAFAFCAWDGGFLPSEIEWQYAAAGGTDNRMYPWGGPSIDITRALYGYCGNGVSSDCTVASISDVGSKPAGVGKFGHMDLAGSMWEWALDIQSSSFPVESPCNDCVNLSGSADRAIRGGSWFEGPSYLTTYERLVDPPDSTWHNVGMRCARSP